MGSAFLVRRSTVAFGQAGVTTVCENDVVPMCAGPGALAPAGCKAGRRDEQEQAGRGERPFRCNPVTLNRRRTEQGGRGEISCNGEGIILVMLDKKRCDSRISPPAE